MSECVRACVRVCVCVCVSVCVYVLVGGIVQLPVHDHRLKHRPLTDDKLDHAMNNLEQLQIRRNDNTNNCIVE